MAIEMADKQSKKGGMVDVRVAICEARSAKALPAKVVVTDCNGMFRDGSGRGVYGDGRFYADGAFTVSVPPGPLSIQVSAGPDYVPLLKRCLARVGRDMRLTLRLRRRFPIQEKRWYCGDNHVHTQHDPTAVIKTDHVYTMLQARSNGLDFLTVARKLSKDTPRPVASGKGEPFVMGYSPEIMGGPFVGHFNVPGVSEKDCVPGGALGVSPGQRLAGVLPGQRLTPLVHELGGAVVYTHPLGPIHQLHWMGATEAVSDAVMGRCADAIDVRSREEEMLWYALLNLGNRVAVSSSTDSALEQLHTRSPGDYRVYAQMSSLRVKNIVEALRNGRTFATNGGALYLYATLDGRLPGAGIEADGRSALELAIEMVSFEAPTQVEIIRNGLVVKRFSVASEGSTRLSWRFTAKENSWYVVRAENAAKQWAITSPFYVASKQARPLPPAGAVMFEIGNFSRHCRLSPEFFGHVIATVSRSAISRVEIVRNGVVVCVTTPCDGDRVDEGRIPVTGCEGAYTKGWIWHPDAVAPCHFQMDIPITRSGSYEARVYIADGRVLRSHQTCFDADNPRSHEMSSLNLTAGDHILSLKGYGEELPLADFVAVRDKKWQWRPASDHWWYPHNTYWEMDVVFGGKLAHHNMVGRPRGFDA